jgi:hypothetical protein
MENTDRHKNEILENGFTIVDEIYSADEVEQIISIINQVDTSKETFRKSTDLFAVRQFLYEVPSTRELIFNGKLNSIISWLKAYTLINQKHQIGTCLITKT